MDSSLDNIPQEIIEDIRASLARLDCAIEAMAAKIGGSISVYREFVPQRSIVVENPGKISRKLGVYPVLRSSEKGWRRDNYEFVFVAHAWIDTGGKRYVWDKTVVRTSIVPETYPEGLRLLEQCWAASNEIAETDLKAPKFR